MVLDKAPLSVDDGTMTKSSDESSTLDSTQTAPVANPAAADTATPPTGLQEEVPDQPDPSKIEVVLVTEEDLRTVETPNTVNVNPVLDKAPLSMDDGTVTKSSDESSTLDSTQTDPDANPAAADTATPPTELQEEVPDPSKIEVVLVTEEDLPAVETPNTVNVSPLSSGTVTLQLENDPVKPEEPKPPTAPSPTTLITKVQPFLNDEDLEKSWKSKLLAHRLELLIASCVITGVTLILGIGLGGEELNTRPPGRRRGGLQWNADGEQSWCHARTGAGQYIMGLSCAGKFCCGSSSKCISRSAQCDGEVNCENGEDELGCVRLSGRSSVLQVRRGSVWRTVCSEDWNNWLGMSACKQLGYSRYVESFSVSLTSIEQDLQTNLVSVYLSQPQIIKLQNTTFFSKAQCSSGKVTTLKCLECGSRPLFSSRIVGGNLSKPGQFPWQVSLHIMRYHLCGGSIITSRWILTAAHCVYGFSDPSLWNVIVGTSQLPDKGPLWGNSASLAVETIIYHHRYRPKRLDYDIALLKLKESLVFSGSVQPICLPNHGEEFEAGTMCWTSGWGATETGGGPSTDLLFAKVPLISTETCNRPEVYNGHISPWMICAGYLDGGPDSCQGDSGGPLGCEDSSAWKLVGVTSWGIGCGFKPGVYARITVALSWIRQQMEVSPS